MKSINFDVGLKEFMINDDPNRIVKFNPSDYAIITRFNEAQKEMEVLFAEMQEKSANASDLEAQSKIIEEVNAKLKASVNKIFAYDIADTVFGDLSPMAMVNGTPLYVLFIESAFAEVKEAVDKENKGVEKYTSKYTKKKETKK